MSRLIRDLAYACIAGHLLGRAIGLLFRWHRERRAFVPHSRRHDHSGLNARWQGKRPNSIG
jgi:hypothetical protein